MKHTDSKQQQYHDKPRSTATLAIRQWIHTGRDWLQASAVSGKRQTTSALARPTDIVARFRNMKTGGPYII
jgi:hypothetical protein